MNEQHLMNSTNYDNHVMVEIIGMIDDWVEHKKKSDIRFYDDDFVKFVKEEALKLKRPLHKEEIQGLYDIYSNKKQIEREIREKARRDGIYYESYESTEDYEEDFEQEMEFDDM